MAMPKVMKNPASQPRTLHDQARARMARQTYSPKSKRAAFCQLKVRNLISWSASSIRSLLIGSSSTLPPSIPYPLLDFSEVIEAVR